MLSCWIKQSTGYDCPGCGIQRSFYMLLEGDLLGSFKMYPALIPFILLIIFTPFHLKFMFKIGHKIIAGLFILTASLAMINFTYKLIVA